MRQRLIAPLGPRLGKPAPPEMPFGLGGEIPVDEVPGVPLFKPDPVVAGAPTPPSPLVLEFVPRVDGPPSAPGVPLVPGNAV